MALLLRKAWRDLRVRPLRTGLTLLGITIGVAGVVAIALAGRTFTEAQRRTYQHTSQADVVVWAWDVPESIVRAVEELPGVAAAERRAITYIRWRAGGIAWQEMELQGLEQFDQVRVNQMTLVEGRFPGRGEIAIESSARELTPLKIGQTVELRDWTGQTVRLAVSGFTRTPYYPSAGLLRFTTGYVPAAQVRSLLGLRGDNYLFIRLRDPARAEETRQEIEALLDRRHPTHGGVSVRNSENYLGRRELETLLRLLTILSILGVVISAFLVTNTFAAIVAEEVREIGILKALGATRWQVLRVYLATGLVYAMVGTPLGLAVGYIGGWQLLGYIGNLMNVDVGPFRPEALATLLGIAIGLGVTVPTSLFPAWRAGRITVQQALQSYGIRADSTPRALRWLRLPPLWAFSLRNLARRPGRSLTTVLVTAVAVAAFLGMRITQSSLERSIGLLFDIYDTDAWIWIESPVGEAFAAELRAVPGVVAAEGWAITGAVIGGEWVRLWGLPAETRLYRYALVDGRWFLGGEQHGAVLSLDLAERQGWHVGDRAEIEIGGRRREFGIVGLVHDEAIYGLGDAPMGKVFLPLGVVQQMYGAGDQVSFFALKLDRHDAAGVDAIVAEIERRHAALRPWSEPIYADRAQARQGTMVVSALLAAVVAIVAVVGMVGILNTQTLNMVERRREIGVLRALGAVREHLVRFFLAEGLALGLLGFALGIPGGWALGRLLLDVIGATLITLHFTFLGEDLALSLLLALLLSTAASLLPALAAARLQTAEVLRYE